MAIRAGTAFVEVRGDFSALNKQMATELGRISANGSSAGKSFSRGFSGGVSTREVSSKGSTLGREFARSFESHAKKIGSGISASLHRNAVRGVQVGAAAIGGALIYAVKQGAAFEQQMSTLGAVTNANAKQMKAFKKQALDAGAATKFSAKQAAKAQTELAKGGLSVKQIMKGGLSAALSLAAAGELDLADAATTTVNAMKLFNLRGKDAKKVADGFATAANATTADVKDFADALTQGGSAAKAAGLSFTETTAFLEALASAGIKGSDAGTSMKTALIQLASPSKAAAGAMEDLGLKFFDAQGKMKSVVDISKLLRDKMGGMTREQRLQTATTLAGTDGMRGLLALYDAGPRKMASYERGLKKTGTAADTAKKKQDNLAGTMENFKGSLETLAIKVGTALIPPIRKVTGQLTNFTNDVSKIFDRKDLDFGEKLSLIWEKAKFRFGPTVDKIEQAIKDAHLDKKLADVIEWATPKMMTAFKVAGTTAAKALWDGFKAAPLWAEALTATFVATKLGLTGPALKGLFSWLKGGKGATGVGGLMGTMGTRANPMWVRIAGGGGGGGRALHGPGTGPLVGAGAEAALLGSALRRNPGEMSRFERFLAKRRFGIETGEKYAGNAAKYSRASKAIGVGEKIAPVLKMGGTKVLGKLGFVGLGLDFGINLLDSKGNPIKATVNTASDLSFGIVPRMKTDGKEKSKFPVELPDAQPGIDKASKQLEAAQQAVQQAATHGGGRFGPAFLVPDAAKVAAAQKKLREAGNKLGTEYATAYTTAVDSHHKFFSAKELTTGFSAELKGLPKEAQTAASQQMIAFARQLEQDGRLPKGATAKIVRDLGKTFNNLPAELAKAGKRGMNALDIELRRNNVLDTANAQLADLKGIWGDFPKIAKFSGQNAADNFNREIKFLKAKVHTSHGEMKEVAKADLKSVQAEYKKWGRLSVAGFDNELKDLGVGGSKRMRTLRKQIVGDAADMATGVKGASGRMKNHLDEALRDMGVKGSKKAGHVRDVVTEALQQMATGSGKSSGNAADALYKALTNMGVNADSILKSLGIKPKPFTLKRPPNALGANGQARPTQRGGHMPGQGDGDSIPAMLEPGEYVLNKRAVSKLGKKRLDDLNFRDAPRFQKGGYAALIRKANQIDSKQYPYSWGGGHNAAFSGPYDCSGAVSALLHAAGLLEMPMVSGDLMNFGQPGPGGQFTIYANPSHVYSKIGNKFWGTSNANPGGGAGYFDGSARAGFAVRHVSLIPPELQKQLIDGPAGNLKDIAQGESDTTRKSINRFIRSQIDTLGHLGGGDDGDGPGAGGDFSKSALRSLWVQAGGNPKYARIAAAIALAESSGNSGASSPNPSGGTNKGLWQIDSGSHSDSTFDPLGNARAAVRISHGGTDWGAWETYATGAYRQFLQRGGPVGALMAMLKTGGDPTGGARAPDSLASPLAHIEHRSRRVRAVKKTKAADKVSKALKKIGFSRTKFDKHVANAAKYSSWAEIAGTLSGDVEEDLQSALNAELVKRAGTAGVALTSDMKDADVLKLFPAADQNAFIDSFLHQHASVNGKTQSEWLTKQLYALFGERNQVLRKLPHLTGPLDSKKHPTRKSGLIKLARFQWHKLKPLYKAVLKQITDVDNKRERMRDVRSDLGSGLGEAKKSVQDIVKEIAAEHKKKKPSKHRLAELNRKLEKASPKIAHLEHERTAMLEGNWKDMGSDEQADLKKRLGHKFNDVLDKDANNRFHNYTRLADDRKRFVVDRNTYRTGLRKIAGSEDAIDESGGTLGDLNAALSDMREALASVQGSVKPPLDKQLINDVAQYTKGQLGGDIFQVQEAIDVLGMKPARAAAEGDAAGSDPSAEQSLMIDLLKQQLNEADKRYKVSQAQYGVFRDYFGAGQSFAYGGSFATGGTVPGPVGAPKMIVAHGGETVLTADESRNQTPDVHVSFNGNAAQFEQFLDKRIEYRTRRDARSAARGIAGGWR